MRKLFEVTINDLTKKIEESHNTVLDEVMSCKDSAGEWIKDFQNSKDPKFQGDSKEKRKQRALAARYAKCEDVNESVGVPVRNALIMLLSAGLKEDDLEEVASLLNNKIGIVTMDKVSDVARKYGLRLGSNLFEYDEGEDPYYVEYHSEMNGENPFKMGDGKKYQYVWAIYPGGKRDIGVYAFSGDLVYSINTFKSMYNIK